MYIFYNNTVTKLNYLDMLTSNTLFNAFYSGMFVIMWLYIILTQIASIDPTFISIYLIIIYSGVILLIYCIYYTILPYDVK